MAKTSLKALPLLTFAEFVERCAPGLSDAERWKVVRHKDNRPEMPDLHRLYYTDPEALEYYQQDQGNPIFRGCDGFFAFIGLPNRRALFFGAYRVLGERHRPAPALRTVPESLRPAYQAMYAQNPASEKSTVYWYDLERDERFKPLEMRVVIDWGPSALAWHQWQLDKEVVELREAGQHEPCPPIMDVHLSLAEFSHIVDHPGANPSWEHTLRSATGIYLLSDEARRRLYVGQAAGVGGFWERWSQYARQRSGNVLVDPELHAGRLKLTETYLSVLAVVQPGRESRAQLDKLEKWWKKRLCSVDVTGRQGLNGN